MTIAATTWAQVARELAAVSDLYEVQFWGHGAPGVACIGSDYLSCDTLFRPEWQALRGKFKGNGVWWFRTCSTFSGDRGRAFAAAFGDLLGIRVAGHTQV